MELRDWELLDKQVWGLRPPRNKRVTVLTVIAVFFSGMIIGGILFAPETQPVRIASSHATAAMACDGYGACRTRSHPLAGSTLVAL